MSMHEMEARLITQPKYERGIIIPQKKEAAEFFRNPPKTIFVPDCYIPENPNTAKAFMEVRASLAASIYHTPLYPTLEDRPVIISFAGVHEDGQSAGSEKVAGLLLERKVPAQKLIALTTTITGTGDVSQLHAILKSHDIESPVAYITSDGYARRARQELINHKRAHPGFSDMVYVLYPSHPVVNVLETASDIDLITQLMIEENLYLGSSGELKHGPMEGLAWALSAIPILRPLKQLAEEKTHEDMRHREQSRYVAKKMQDAAEKLRLYRNILQEKYPYHSKDKSKIKPDDNSAMALAPGLYTKVEDRGGPNDKEKKIKKLTDELKRFTDIPGHG